MIDIQKQISYWKESSDEDWDVAHDLLKINRIRQALFFAHLSLEKTIKALICSKTGDIAPKIHNLVRLSETAGVALSDAKRDFLAEMNSFNIEGRYPESSIQPPSCEMANQYIVKTGEIRSWLISQLEK
jgi:HEPN domain-containing protein